MASWLDRESGWMDGAEKRRGENQRLMDRWKVEASVWHATFDGDLIVELSCACSECTVMMFAAIACARSATIASIRDLGRDISIIPRSVIE